jgi:hypothetical protein
MNALFQMPFAFWTRPAFGLPPAFVVFAPSAGRVLFAPKMWTTVGWGHASMGEFVWMGTTHSSAYVNTDSTANYARRGKNNSSKEASRSREIGSHKLGNGQKGKRIWKIK